MVYTTYLWWWFIIALPTLQLKIVRDTWDEFFAGKVICQGKATVMQKFCTLLTGAKRREWMGMGVAGIIIDS